MKQKTAFAEKRAAIKLLGSPVGEAMAVGLGPSVSEEEHQESGGAVLSVRLSLSASGGGREEGRRGKEEGKDGACE